jgi:hypothetical protein
MNFHGKTILEIMFKQNFYLFKSQEEKLLDYDTFVVFSSMQLNLDFILNTFHTHHKR